VNRPGTYSIAYGETLSSLINKADGYKNNAYPFGGILNNKKALELNQIAKEKLYTSFVQKLITKGDQLFASESLPFILEELKRSEVTGRVMAEFDLDVIKATPSLDTTIDNGDEIIVPIKSEQVYIFGEINQTGAIRYEPSKDINYYISSVGGLLESSDKSNIFVIHPNGEINKLNNVNRLSLLNNRSNDILIYPGSVIYVPREVKSRDASIIASIWAPIVSSAATSITALSVLNKQ
jgi:protein involved in polysaccharide export with SLBB domain